MTGRRVLIGCLAVCLAASSAAANPRPDDAPAESAEVRELARRGAEEQAAGRHEAAVAAFSEAAERSHAPRYAALVGLNQAALDRWVEAYRALEEALQHRDDAWIARNAAVLDAELARVRRHVAWLHFDGMPPGASVSVNGARVGDLPMSDDVPVTADAPAELVTRAEGFEPDIRTVPLVAGETVAVRIDLPPATPDSPVEVTPPPTASGRAPPPVFRPPARRGAHQAGEQTRASYTWASLGAGVALISLTTTVILAVANNDAEREYDAACRGPAVAPAGCVDTWRQSQSAIDDRTNVIIATSIGAAVGTAVATYFLLFPDRSPPPLARARARFRFAAAGAGLRVTW